MAAPKSPAAIKPLLKGISNIQFTPFTADNKIDVDALREHTRFMIESGIVNGKGLQVIGGSNGEGFSLSFDEYKLLIDTIVQEAAGRVPIIVGCIRAATIPVIRIAKYAEEAGADGLMLLAPYYYPACREDVVVEHFRAVAEATNLGIMIYNNPTVTGQDLSVNLLCRLAEIDNIVALKECTSSMEKLREVMLKLGDRFAMIPNATRYLMPFDFQMGAHGFITVYGNNDPAYALKMLEVSERGDFQQCQKMWEEVLDLSKFLYASGLAELTARAKEMCRMAGRPMGDLERLPLRLLTDTEKETLRDLMQQTGMHLA